MDFRIVVFGDKHAASRLEGIAANAANTRPAMEEIYLTILDIEEEAFDNEGARSGFTRWHKLALATVVYKVKRHLSPAILEETGRLRTAMTTFRHPDQYSRIERDKIVFSPRLPSIPYGRIHQFGGVAGGSLIPARPYIRFSETDKQAFGRELLRHVMKDRTGPGKINLVFDV
jgi:phage gpG-like protein